VDQTSANAPATSAVQAPQESQPTEVATHAGPGFRTRGRTRRRVRFLRKARELAYRDLGGLVFNLHRFGQRNDALVIAKLGTLSQIDAELRSLETALDERQPVTVLREAGITACPRCAAIHSGEDRFCPNCGLPMSRHVDLPIAGAPAAAGAPLTTVSGGGASGTTASPPTSTPPQPAAAPAPATPPASAAPAPSAPPPSTTAPPAPATPRTSAPAPSGETEPTTKILRPPAAGA
jgi:hypothetical protein